MGGPRSKATAAQISEPFHTGEGFKAVAARLGMSPNTLRKKWKAEFGEAAFKERGRALQAKAAAKTARSIAKTRVFKEQSVPCSTCGAGVLLTSARTRNMDLSRFQCHWCKYDRSCPVCGQGVDGRRGLSTHFRMQRERDEGEHLAYKEEREAARWAGQLEGEDYVRCRVCDYKGLSLASHLRLHDLTASEYREQYGQELRMRAGVVRAKHRDSVAVSWETRERGGTKPVQCPQCGQEHEVSKFFVPSVHNVWCPDCSQGGQRALEAAFWEGLSESEDYVTCLLCGHQAGNLSSHLQSVHSDVEYDGPVMASRCEARIPVNKLNLTAEDLAPYLDEKDRVEVAKAAEGLGCSWLTVLRYARKLGLPTRNRLARQKQVLDVVSLLLGEDYAWEWRHPEIKSPETGYHLFFDGCFDFHKLVVEVHGKQHYEYVPYWHKTEAGFQRRVRIDAYKERRVKMLGYRMLVVRYDEPVTQEALLARLAGVGVVPDPPSPEELQGILGLL